MPFVAATAKSFARIELDEDEQRLINQAKPEDFLHVPDAIPCTPHSGEVASEESHATDPENFHEEKPNS